MKISCGTDIIEIERIKNAMEKYKEKFQSEIFTEAEISYCESKGNQKFQHYAARFAAKEAIFKAISEKLGNNYSWQDFEVINDPLGKPKVYLKSEIDEIEDIDISLSHCKQYAVASVVVLFE